MMEVESAKIIKAKNDKIIENRDMFFCTEESFMRILYSKEKAMCALDNLDETENKECGFLSFLDDDKIKKINSNVFLVSENDDFYESHIYNDNDSTADL